ncbi:hypothetical protein Q9966_010184 [Columba livia]|nr:hypothetical protein Q9966_010184 [Columba livia]
MEMMLELAELCHCTVRCQMLKHSSCVRTKAREKCHSDGQFAEARCHPGHMSQKDNLLLDDTELVQDLEVTLVAGFVADITVIDLCQRGDEEKWCECETEQLNCRHSCIALPWPDLGSPQGHGVDSKLEKKQKNKSSQKNESKREQKTDCRKRPRLISRIGIREVLLTSGCPGTEEKCIVRVEECQGPVDCGWGIPIPEDPTCVKMPCISIPPENQFTYTWKMLIANKTSHLLLNDSAVLKVCRDTHSLIFQCETQKNGNTIASVKYRVYAATGMQTIKPKTIEMNPSSKTMLDAILVFCVITGFIVIALEIFAMIFIVVFWGVLKSVWQLKSEQDKKLANKK